VYLVTATYLIFFENLGASVPGKPQSNYSRACACARIRVPETTRQG
jgi:hypothetical protein